jgi:MFS family permease
MSVLSQPPTLSTKALSGTAGRGASPRLVLAIVCAGVVLASLDLFIVNVALPQIARDFHVQGTGLAGLSWVLNGYAIVYAAFLVLFARIAERYRRERAFMLGVAVFVAASAACGAASSVTMLVVFRILQAAGAALLTPTSLGLILATFPPEGRHGAVRAWTAVGGLAATLGPVIGGLLVAVSWRWVFLVNVPIGLLALVAGWRWLPRVEGHPVPAPDAVGAVLITGGVAALVLGLVNGSDWGWGSANTIAALAAGAVLLLFSAAFGAMLLSRVLWAQDVWHWSPLVTGLSIAPGPLMVPFFSFLVAGRLTARFGPGPVIAAGATIFALGTVWWALELSLHADYVTQMLGGMLLTGVGVGLTLPTMMATGTSSLPSRSFATGSAVVNMFRQIGLAVGVAVLIAILGSPHSSAATLNAYRDALAVIAAISVASGIAGVALLVGRRSAHGRLATTPGPAAAATGEPR